ncbi:hypothetical protein PMI22_05248, partial [Pseudomonas sp. GM21]
CLAVLVSCYRVLRLFLQMQRVA